MEERNEFRKLILEKLEKAKQDLLILIESFIKDQKSRLMAVPHTIFSIEGKRRVEKKSKFLIF